MTVVGTRGRPRKPALEAATQATYEGTKDVVSALVAESTSLPAWRPVRAAAIMALALRDAPEDQVWMTTEEFTLFRNTYFKSGKRGGSTKLLKAAIGISVERLKTLLEGGRVRKMEALACAHYALGLALPVPAGDIPAFTEWFGASFGQTRAVAIALGLGQAHIRERMNGSKEFGGNVYSRAPEEPLIRALDWTLRVGPFSPYGHRLQAPAFPGQVVKEV